MLEVGRDYGNRTAIRSAFGGQQMHGITLDNNLDIMLFSNSHLYKKRGRKHFYLDRFFYDSPEDMIDGVSGNDYENISICLYSGIGRTGDQNIAANSNRPLNLEVINHLEKNKKIHLFKSVKNSRKITYKYVGQFKLKKHFFEYQEDETRTFRKVYIFELERVNK